MRIERANSIDVNAMEEFYRDVTKHLEATINYPGWVYDIYPIREDAENNIQTETLYVVRDKDRIAGSFIMSHECHEGYNDGDWSVKAEKDEFLVIHTLCVHPDYLRHGLGKMMVEEAIRLAKEYGMKALRLDVYEGNEPAASLYERYGFKACGRADMRISDDGPEWCTLYELDLQAKEM